jgi:hypothetical protein
MANLIIRVVNEKGQPLPGVAATLTGVGAPQMLVTDNAGQAVFQNLSPGRYTLLTALEGLNVRSTSISMEAADKTVPINMSAADEDSPRKRGKWFYVSQDVLQILSLIALAVLFAVIIYKAVESEGFNLATDDAARGLITFLVAVVTVGIALILVLAAILGSGGDLEKRLGFGKEVFAILIGVLGTIMGFYYGQATKDSAGQGAITTSSAVTVTPGQPQLNQPFTISTAVTGGTAPYKYSIKFNPDVVVPNDDKPTDNQTSTDGKISREFKFKPDFKPDAPKGTPLNFVLDVKDAGGKTLTFDSDKEGTTLVIKPITATATATP